MKEFGITFPVLLDDTRFVSRLECLRADECSSIFWVAQDGEIEVSSVGWVKADFEEINRRMAEAGKSCAGGLCSSREKMCAISARVEDRRISRRSAESRAQSASHKADRCRKTSTPAWLRYSVGGCTLVHGV